MKPKHFKIIATSFFSVNFVVLLFAILSYFIVPVLKDIFGGFGAELPAPTRFIIATYKYSIIPPAIVLAVLCKVVLRKENAQKLRVYLLISFGIGVLMAAVILVLWYCLSVLFSPGGMGEIK